MKKLFKTFLSLLMIILLSFSFTNAQAAQTPVSTSDDWISQALSDYEQLQTLKKKYPDTEMVENTTKYILNETKKDKDGNTLAVNKREFSNDSDLEKYLDKIKKEEIKKEKKVEEKKDGTVTTYMVEDGQTKYVTYTKIKVGLALYKYSSEKFFVACVYTYTTKPEIDLTYHHQGIAGLALGTQLAMDGQSSYGGRVTITNYLGEETVRNTINGELSIQATGTQGIGYSVHESETDLGLITGLEGVISCTATQTNPSDTVCSAFGEYDYVRSTIGGFSVSYPSGISVGLATVRTRYTIQDALDLR